MKTVLDFTRVPLDKWVDLYNYVGRTPQNGTPYCWKDINQLASVEVKEQSDYDAEVAEAVTLWWDDSGNSDKAKNLSALISARKEALPKEDKEDTEVRSTLDVAEVIK
jgi:hypothetical protein